MRVVGARIPLTELLAEFLKLDQDARGWRVDATFDDCDGVWLLCPKCYLANGRSAVGTHMVVCWKPHVPQTVDPKPGRWAHAGTSLSDLTLVAGSSSIAIHGGCNAHFWIRGGAAEDVT